MIFLYPFGGICDFWPFWIDDSNPLIVTTEDRILFWDPHKRHCLLGGEVFDPRDTFKTKGTLFALKRFVEGTVETTNRKFGIYNTLWIQVASEHILWAFGYFLGGKK